MREDGVMRALLIAMVGLVIGGTGISSAAVTCVPIAPLGRRCVINNGLAPPNPENVIDDATYGTDYVYVRNVGCPPDWPSGFATDACPDPGAATEVEVAGVVRELAAHDSSAITIREGAVLQESLSARDFSAVTIDGGTMMEDADVSDSATITINGGSVYRFGAGGDGIATMSGGSVEQFAADGDATVTINGGWVSEHLHTWGSGTVTIDGGSVWGVSSYLSSAITISGGRVQDHVGALNSSTITITGGLLSANVLSARQSSTIAISGGTVGSNEIKAFDLSTVTITGGVTSVYALSAQQSSTITISGGTVRSVWLQASDSSTITIVGRNFEVDGVPVPYGDLTAQTGTITGLLASGDIDSVFYQAGWTGFPCSVSFPCSGTITLVPPDYLPTLSPWSQLALMAGLLGAGLGVWRRRKA